MDGPQGKQVGRQALAAGQTGNLIAFHDPEGTPPSQWTLIVFDPNGGSSVLVTMGHDFVTFNPNLAALPLLAAGLNVIPLQTFGSSVTVRILAATATTFDAMIVRVNR